MIKKEYKQPSMRILKLQLEKMIAASPGSGQYQFDENGDNGNGTITPDDGTDESD